MKVSLVKTCIGSLLLASACYGASIQLQWDYTVNSRIPTHFNLYRQDNCLGSFIQRVQVPYPNTSTVDTVSFNTLYCWQVTAFDINDPDSNTKESVPSAVLRFQVPKETLAMPVNLHVQ